MFDPAIPVHIFVSYARADADLQEQLAMHLAPIRRHEAVHLWSDRGIEAGEEWDDEIRRRLAEADVILLLVSTAFLASEYIYEVELGEALEKHERGEAIVIPVILKKCLWEQEAFARLQALPRGARPITQWPDRDEAFYEVAQGVRRAVERVQQRRRGKSE